MKSKETNYVYCIESKDYVLKHFLGEDNAMECSYYSALKFESRGKAESYLRKWKLEDVYEVTEHEELDFLFRGSELGY